MLPTEFSQWKGMFLEAEKFIETYCGVLVIMTVYSLVSGYQHCRETSCLCLQGRRTFTLKTGVYVLDYML